MLGDVLGALYVFIHLSLPTTAEKTSRWENKQKRI